jgi:hypothetical protein
MVTLISKKKSSVRAGNTASSPSDNVFLTKKDVARKVGVSLRTIDTWMRRKKIPYLALSARMVKFHWPSVETALFRFNKLEIGRRVA